MADDLNAAALADTRARLLALEMVTTAVLNQLVDGDPKLQSLIGELAAPSKVPDAARAGGADNLDHLQANVQRLAGAIANPL
ncbi:MAG: hypothetical protein AB1942_23890 [Pseudomonadota bacterium]